MLGCAQNNSGLKQQSFKRFKDIPIPEKTLLNTNLSTVVGKNNYWNGVLYFSSLPIHIRSATRLV